MFREERGVWRKSNYATVFKCASPALITITATVHLSECIETKDVNKVRSFEAPFGLISLIVAMLLWVARVI